jgi:hypothetical protein
MALTSTADITRAIIAGDFTNDDFVKIIDAVKFARSQLGKETKRSLRIGSTVKYRSVKQGGEVTGKVTKIAIKYVTVDCGVRGSWKVPAAMLEVV